MGLSISRATRISASSPLQSLRWKAPTVCPTALKETREGKDREGVGREDGRQSGKERGVREGWWREEERWRKSERIRGRRGSEMGNE
jgi:hypothetical protein